MEKIFQRLTPIFRDVFEDDTLTLSPAMTADDVPGWDSLNHIRLVLQIQKEFGIKLSAAQTVNLNNVGELVALIGAKTEAAA